MNRPITKREQQVLQFIAEGFTTAEISGKLCISETTVIFHRKNITKKLAARNGCEMIYNACSLNLIDF